MNDQFGGFKQQQILQQKEKAIEKVKKCISTNRIITLDTTLFLAKEYFQR